MNDFSQLLDEERRALGNLLVKMLADMVAAFVVDSYERSMKRARAAGLSEEEGIKEFLKKGG